MDDDKPGVEQLFENRYHRNVHIQRINFAAAMKGLSRAPDSIKSLCKQFYIAGMTDAIALQEMLSHE